MDLYGDAFVADAAGGSIVVRSIGDALGAAVEFQRLGTFAEATG